jgi:hypothetical protein
MGNIPVAQMNPAIYPPGQRVAQFTSFTSWRVDVYFHGWDAWHAVYFDNTGAQRTDAWFHYGDPNAGLPPNAQPQAGQPGQVQPGQQLYVPTLVPGYVAPFPTLFPRARPPPSPPLSRTGSRSLRWSATSSTRARAAERAPGPSTTAWVTVIGRTPVSLSAHRPRGGQGCCRTGSTAGWDATCR